MLKLLWPLLIVNLRIGGLIWRGAANFVQNKTTIILRWSASGLPCRTPATSFWRKIGSLETQNVSYFSIWYGFLGIVNPFSRIFNAISSEKNCLVSMPFMLTYIDVRTVKLFPPSESWLVNSNYRRAGQTYARIFMQMQIKLIFIRKILHKDSFWNRGTR